MATSKTIATQAEKVRQEVVTAVQAIVSIAAANENVENQFLVESEILNIINGIHDNRERLRQARGGEETEARFTSFARARALVKQHEETLRQAS